MEEANPDKIVTDEWLKAQGFSDSWIARHSTACGVIGRRPRRYFLSRIMAHLNDLAEQSVAKSGGKRKRKEASRQIAEKIFVDITRKQKASGNGSGVANFADHYRSYKKGGE